MTLEQLSPYLEDLERRIDEEVESNLVHQWMEFTEGRWNSPVFAPHRPVGNPPGVPWPAIQVNATFDDPLLMLLHQLSINSRILEAGTGDLLGIRVNYGTPTVPSVFGARLFFMPDETNTLPACHPLPGGLDGVLECISHGKPDINAGLGTKVFSTGQLFLDVLHQYPVISKHIKLYHPDFQGPMDVTELLIGSSIFTDLIDRPEDIHAVLQSVTRTYHALMEKWLKLVPPSAEWSVHWNMLHRGTIMLRDDSATNLSPAMFEEFVEPYDTQLLRAFGGGAMHFCGRGDRFIEIAAAIPSLFAVHMSQPELNDIERICQHTVDRGLNLIGAKKESRSRFESLGRELNGRVHFWDGIPK
jgi:hypothetical protein